MKQAAHLALTLGTIGVLMVSCAPQKKEWQPDTRKKDFGMVYRQLPPQPVYNRLRLVYLPEPLPSETLPDSRAPRLNPVIHLELKNVTLEQAASSLAASARYKGSCAPELSSRRITFNSLGTIDELAQAIAKAESIRVDIDHQARTVSFTNSSALPSFYEGGAQSP